MDNKSIAATILLVLVSLPTGIAEIVTKPTDTEVVVGGSTYLNCSTNRRQKINWFHTKVGKEKQFIYRNNTVHPSFIDRFLINEANGVYNLVIPSVKIEDAGIYGCQEETEEGSKRSAQLIVIDSVPACEPRSKTLEIIGPNNCGIEPTQLILSCSVGYHGNEAPILTWRKVSDDTLISEGVTHETIDNNRVVYNLTIKGNSNVKDGDSYFCNTTRSATLDDGCRSSEVKVKGKHCPTCAASESCEPYKAALICFFLIILPITIGGTIFVFWFLKIHRPKKLENGGTSTENPRSNHTTLADAGTEEEKVMLNTPATSSGKCTNGPDVKIRTLENQLKTLSETINRQNNTISELTQKDVSNNEKIESLKLENNKNIKLLQLENDHLKTKLKHIEQRLYPRENIDYLDKPVLAHMIELSDNGKDTSEKHNEMSEKNKRKAINGIAVLGEELFIVTKRSQEIAVYDSKTFQNQRKKEIRGMTDPLDIASSKDANCLYIVDQSGDKNESKVMRIDSRGKVLHQWLTGGSKGRLSTYGSNVILCLSDKQLINEYSPEGELIAAVRLSPAAKLNNPLHAIKVTSTHFVVSHGDFNDELHRVCVVDLNGEIIKECTKWEKSTFMSNAKMKVPLCLLEDNEGSMIVADTDHKRILLLSSMLKYQRNLIEDDNGLKDFPVRLCFDDTQSRLYLAVNKWSDSRKEWKDGRIQIFNIK